jgi:hypothetical protein
MIEPESSGDRSVNKGTICGVVIRTIKNEKKPINVSVTAAMAAIRAAPSDLTNWKKACTGSRPNLVAPITRRYPARFAQFMVSVRLIPANRKSAQCAGRQGEFLKPGRANENAGGDRRRRAETKR